MPAQHAILPSIKYVASQNAILDIFQAYYYHYCMSIACPLLCLLSVRCMCITCLLSVHSMPFIWHTLVISYIPHICPSYVFAMCIISPLYVHSMTSLWPSHAQYMSTICPLHVYYMFITCPVYVYHKPVVYPQHMPNYV